MKRINAFLRDCGLGSRRDVEKHLLTGRISVNGVTVKQLGSRVCSNKDQIQIDGKMVVPCSLVYYKFHKPKNTLCSRATKFGEHRIYDIVPEYPPIFSIGRLDKETTGLLLLTNDGDFAQKVIHPSSRIIKKYIVTTRQAIQSQHIETIKRGMFLYRSLSTPHSVKKLHRHTMEICLWEGKKREIRLLLQKNGLCIAELTRIAIGSLHLCDLPLGSCRPLSQKERRLIFQ